MSKKLLIPLFVLVLAIASVLLVSKLPEIKPSRDCEMEQLLGKLSEMGYDTGKIKYSDESLEILTLKLRENGTLRPLGPLGKIAILPPGRSSREERDCYTIPGYSVTCKEKEEGGTEITFGRSRKIEVNGIEFEMKLSIVSWETKGTLRDGSQIRASLGLPFNEIREVLSLVLNEIPKYPEENVGEKLRNLYEKLSEEGYSPEVIYNPQSGVISIQVGNPPFTICQVMISRKELSTPIKGTKEILKSDSLGEIRVIRERFHYPPSLYSEIEVNETKLGAWISGIKANEEEIEKVLIILKEAAKDMKNCDEYITSEMKKLGYEKQLPGEILCEEEFEIFPFGKTEEEVRLAEAFDEFLRKSELGFIHLWIIPGEEKEVIENFEFKKFVKECLSKEPIDEIEVGKSKAKVYRCVPHIEVHREAGREAYFTLFEFGEEPKTLMCFSTDLREMKEIISEISRCKKWN